MELLTFVPEQLLVLVVATYVLGLFLKRLEAVKDKYIVLILMAFSIAFSLIMQGLGAVAILQGIICWGVSVGIKQIEVQLKKVE